MTTATYVPPQVIQRAERLAWTIKLGAITADALAVRDQLSPAIAQEYLDEVVALGLLYRKSILVGYSALYAATRSGRILARRHVEAGGYSYPLGIRTARINIQTARHMIACASSVAALERRYFGHRVVGERELQRDERELQCAAGRQARRLASVDIKRYGETRAHFPDIVIWAPPRPGELPPLPIAVEVELTPKGKAARTAICRAWACAQHVGMVLYFAETTRIEEKLLDTIEELKAEEMIVVNPLGTLVKSLPGFDLSSTF
jgi:hypothetical protein